MRPCMWSFMCGNEHCQERKISKDEEWLKDPEKNKGPGKLARDLRFRAYSKNKGHFRPQQRGQKWVRREPIDECMMFAVRMWYPGGFMTGYKPE